MMPSSLQKELHLIADPNNLDSAVNEVFATMLGLECKLISESGAVDGPGSSVAAVVGFGGLLSGTCVFQCDAASAIEISSRLTGMTFDSLDDTVRDAVGEMSNMLAGAWKSRVPVLSANCGLSVPTVISGRDYKLHVQAPKFHMRHAYCFDGGSFEVTIVCDDLQSELA